MLWIGILIILLLIIAFLIKKVRFSAKNPDKASYHISKKEREGMKLLVELLAPPEHKPKEEAYLKYFSGKKGAEKRDLFARFQSGLRDAGYELFLELPPHTKALDLAKDLQRLASRNFASRFDPDVSDFSENATIQQDEIFMQLEQQLRSIGFQIGFIDVFTDDYVIALFRVKDKFAVSYATTFINYRLFEVE